MRLLELLLAHQLIYRASAALLVSFVVLAGVTSCTPAPHTGWWPMKFTLSFGLFIAFWWGTNDGFATYANWARFLSIGWLMMQNLLCLDAARGARPPDHQDDRGGGACGRRRRPLQEHLPLPRTGLWRGRRRGLRLHVQLLRLLRRQRAPDHHHAGRRCAVHGGLAAGQLQPGPAAPGLALRLLGLPELVRAAEREHRGLQPFGEATRRAWAYVAAGGQRVYLRRVCYASWNTGGLREGADGVRRGGGGGGGRGPAEDGRGAHGGGPQRAAAGGGGAEGQGRRRGGGRGLGHPGDAHDG
ncbi:unnamed protein product, partial [Heterosigma akashiwo]